MRFYRIKYVKRNIRCPLKRDDRIENKAKKLIEVKRSGKVGETNLEGMMEQSIRTNWLFNCGIV